MHFWLCAEKKSFRNTIRESSMFGPVNARQIVGWDGPNDYKETCYQQTGNDIDNGD